MKNVLLGSILIMAADVGAAVHPLKDAVHNLARASAELEGVISSGRESPEVKARAEDVKRQVDSAWVNAFVAQFEIADQKMQRLGYFTKPDRGGLAYSTHKNQNARQLEGEAQSFQAERWIELGQAVDEGIAAIETGTQLLADPKYQVGVVPHSVYAVQETVAPLRADSLKNIRLRVNATLKCIEFYSKAISEGGLRPVVGSGNYEWSEAEIRRVYGVGSIAALSVSQKKRVVDRIRDMLNFSKSNTCMAPDAWLFMNNELTKLKGA